MKYLYSQIDKDNISWFANDMTVASLTEITLLEGSIRGLFPCKIELKYPISVIAGRNKSGKSTILALAACAFHNDKNGFKLSERKNPYYTFSDFFIQSSEEMPPEGVKLRYRFMHNNWAISPRVPNGIGNLWQIRSKRKGGKWSKYSRRVDRNVVYYGVLRVVPPYEKSVSKSYRSQFSFQVSAEWENNVKTAVGRILQTTYDSFRMMSYEKYHLPLVKVKDIVYSGFNMGAGENALFEIFSTIYTTPRGTLLVIDEIELGLHEDAQKRLIDELKHVCRERHIQVICTTHSQVILATVPPEARFFVQSYLNKTDIIPEISSLNAAGKLSGQKSGELDIFVEDEVADIIISSCLDTNERKRSTIIPIGSPPTIIHQMAARFKEKRSTECIAIMDGDQATSVATLKAKFIKALEHSTDQEKDLEWLTQRIAFLPGDTWPEKWLMNSLLNMDITELAQIFGLPQEELKKYIEDAKRAEKHSEFYVLGQNLSLNTQEVARILSQWIVKQKQSDFNQINQAIKKYLT